MSRIVPTINNYILNKDLLNKIDEGLNSKICFIKSPSGNGKTSLLAKWIEDKNFSNIYWYSMKKIDNVPSLFFRNFFGGLKNMLQKPEFSAVYENYNDSVVTSEEMAIMANSIENELLTFVIDDFHNLSYEILNLLKTFINNTGYKIRFLIASRDPIPTEFSDLLIRQEIAYIENKYAFGFDETKEFFEAREIRLNDASINKIISYTNGWIPAYVSIAFGIIRSNNENVEYNDAYLFNFIKQTVWDEYDANTKSLFRLAVVNNGEIVVDMASKILDIDKSTVLDIIARESHFLIRNSERKYLLAPIMIAFVETEFNLPLRKSFNLKIAKYFYDKRKDAASVLFYFNAEAYDLLVKPLKRLAHDNNYLDYDEVRYVLYNIPNHFIFKSPSIIMGIVVDSFNRFDLDSVRFYLDKLNGLDQLSDSTYLEEVDKIKKYLVLYNLSRDNKNIIERIKSLSEKNKIKRIETVNPCYIFPSILRGLRDFSDVYPTLLMSADSKQVLEKVLGSFGGYVYEMGLAETKLEIGYPSDAIMLASNIIFSNTRSVPVEIHLIGACIMLRGFIALNTPEKALNILNSIKRRMLDDKYRYMIPNCRALFAKYYMAVNESNLVSDWLTNHANIDLDMATFRDYYLIKTKARILYEKKDYTEALIIINFLIRISSEYKRMVDLGEYYFMKASICYYLDDFEQCIEHINKSLSILEPRNYKMVYYEYGQLGIKTLEESLEYLDSGRRNYVESIIAKKDLYIHERQEKLISNEDVKELTATEIRILKLIDRAYSNDQICDELGIKITTVKTHISNIFAKLGVKNRFQAVKIAKDLDVI